MELDRGIYADFYRSMISVQQENGRLILYIVIALLLMLPLLICHLMFPPEDTYLVDGVDSVLAPPIYWNLSDADWELLSQRAKIRVTIQHDDADVPHPQMAGTATGATP